MLSNQDSHTFGIPQIHESGVAIPPYIIPLSTHEADFTNLPIYYRSSRNSHIPCPVANIHFMRFLNSYEGNDLKLHMLRRASRAQVLKFKKVWVEQVRFFEYDAPVKGIFFDIESGNRIYSFGITVEESLYVYCSLPIAAFIPDSNHSAFGRTIFRVGYKAGDLAYVSDEGQPEWLLGEKGKELRGTVNTIFEEIDEMSEGTIYDSSVILET